MRTILCQLKVRLLVGLKIYPLRISIMDICHTRIVPPRWQIVSERSTSYNSGCEPLSHRPTWLVDCDQPFRCHIKASVVGAG